MLRTGRAVVDYVRETSSPAILQVHAERLQGHSPADPEHGEEARRRSGARAEADPLKIFEATGALPQDVLDEREEWRRRDVASAVVKEGRGLRDERKKKPAASREGDSPRSSRN